MQEENGEQLAQILAIAPDTTKFQCQAETEGWSSASVVATMY